MGEANPVADLASLVGRSFIQRRDAIAQQLGEGDSPNLPCGAYRPVRTRVSRQEYQAGIKGDLVGWTKSHIEDHISGQMTYGHYVLDLESNCRLLAFDCDFEKIYPFKGKDLKVREIFGTEHPAAIAMNESIRCVADALAFKLKASFPQLRVCCSFSGSKGIHVYGLFSEEVPGRVAKAMALDVISSMVSFERGKAGDRDTDKESNSDIFWRPYRDDLPIQIEVFPKQEEVSAGGFGNLLGLPLGYNKKTRRAKFFYDPHSDPRTITPMHSETAIIQGLQLTP